MVFLVHGFHQDWNTNGKWLWGSHPKGAVPVNPLECRLVVLWSTELSLYVLVVGCKEDHSMGVAICFLQCKTQKTSKRKNFHTIGTLTEHIYPYHMPRSIHVICCVFSYMFGCSPFAALLPHQYSQLRPSYWRLGTSCWHLQCPRHGREQRRRSLRSQPACTPGLR